MALPPGVEVTVDRLTEFLEAVTTLANLRVMVGIPAEKGYRQGEPINNAALGYIHENGAPEAGIPARAWLKPGVKESRDAWVPHVKAAGQAALNFKGAGAVERELTRAGMAARNGAVRKITEGPFVPLKPATIAARRRRGRTGTRPLIDTGKLRQAISFVVRHLK